MSSLDQRVLPAGLHHRLAGLAGGRAPNRLGLDPRPIEDHFAARCRAVLRVPYDKHLDRGTPPAAAPWLRVAAVVARGLSMHETAPREPWPRGPTLAAPHRGWTPHSRGCR